MTIPVTLGTLLDRIGLTLLTPVAGPGDTSTPVSSVTVYDPLDPVRPGDDALVLGVGVPEPAAAVRLIETVAGTDVAGIVLRDKLTDDAEVAQAAHAGDVTVLELIRGASWIQITSILSSILEGADGPLAAPESADDLFTLANSIAAIVGGPITIENTSSSIVAFSADQGNSDDARRESVLSHEVPDGLKSRMRDDGTFRRVYASADPVFIEAIGKSVRARVVMRLQAGGEILGSIWVVADSPLPPVRADALKEAAGLVAMTMLRDRVARDSAARLQSSLVSTLLGGGAEARDAAAHAGVAGGPACVMAVCLDHPHPADAAAEQDLQHLTGVFTMYLKTASPRAQAALLGRTIYAVLPTGDVEQARAGAEDFVRRVRSSPRVCIGIGRPVDDVARLAGSKRDADRTLRVLRGRDGDAAVATSDDVQVDTLLVKMSDFLGETGQRLTGPLVTLRDYDGAHGTQLTATLRSWLDHFGDVGRAADCLHVHKNTFRYRMRRVEEITRVDLADVDERFALMLQLRLFPDACSPKPFPDKKVPS